jgi:D-3-phosphoglycerate dehydrogenase / 2-oxoglutarate reductase
VRLVRGDRVLAAGDRFVLSELILEALQREASGALEVSTLDLPWPVEPYGPVAEVEEASGTEEQMIEAVNSVEVVVTQLAPLTARVLEAANNLRLVVCTRGGPVNVNVEAASQRGVAVCYAPGRNAPAAAEYAVGLMLAAMRRIPEAHGSLSSGQWRGEFYAYEECGVELDGATVGLVGFGAIGRRVARVLVAFGARVVVYDPFVDAADIEEAGGSSVKLDELLERSRAVSLHARLSPDTRGMIGAHEISRMSRDSVLVNTARGGLLDYDALCDALESGHLGAAALDVYPEEPVPEDSRILKAPRLVLSPHIAGATKETAQRAARIAAEEVGRYVRGEQLLNVINSEAVGDLA